MCGLARIRTSAQEVRVTKLERSWVAYDWANSAYSITVTAAIFPIFFKGFAAHGLENYQSTSILAFGNSTYTLIIALLAPILGTISDFRSYKKRFFSVFLAMGVVGTIALALVAQGHWLPAIIIYVASSIGFAGANIFYDSFLVDVTSRERMDWISASGFAWGYIGSTIPFILGMALIVGYKTFGFGDNIPAVRIAFLITGVWWFVFSGPILRNVKQVHFLERSAHPIRDSFRRMADTLRHIRAFKVVFVFLLAYFFYIDGVDTIITMATAYGTDAGISSTMLLVILLAIQIVAFPFALVYGRLAEKTSARFMLFVGIGVYVVITMLAFFLPALPTRSAKTLMFWVLSMLVATSQGGIQAISRSYFGKIIPPEKSAEFFGFYNIFGKFSAILGPLLLGLGTALFRTSQAGVLSIVVLFIAGGFVLSRVPSSSSVMSADA